jgi:ATP-dependent RNA helicase DDX5/DBP2
VCVSFATSHCVSLFPYGSRKASTDALVEQHHYFIALALGVKTKQILIIPPTTTTSIDSDSVMALADKKDRKIAMKKEAEALGISYEDFKKRSKKRKAAREAESLESEEHKKEINRMRAYSKELDGGDDGAEGRTKSDTKTDDDGKIVKRRRTRSMDVAEENKVIAAQEKRLSPDEWRKEHTLSLRGHGEHQNILEFPAPYIEFNDSPFSARVKKALTSAGFARPTPIQAQAWPLAVDGKDLISIAKTGSGKTCGFLLPVFHHHEQATGGQYNRGFVKPILLVLAPTRELSVQILEEAQKFGRPLGIRSVCCYGGSSKYPQIAALQRGIECIIACPGRLNDLIEMKKVDLSGIKYLVLDEADRMLDMVRFVMFSCFFEVSTCIVSYPFLRLCCRNPRDLNHRSDPLWRKFRLSDKPCSFPQLGQRKFNVWLMTFCETPFKSMWGKLMR